MTTFYSRFEKALRKSATAAAVDAPRLDRRRPGRRRQSGGDEDRQAQYKLFGPGDVQRLAAGAITRRFPAPNASDAEVTKIALVEFARRICPGATRRDWRRAATAAVAGARGRSARRPGRSCCVRTGA